VIGSKDLKSIHEILIVDFSLIGDMVMNIPFLRVIKRNCPECKITMVCQPWAETVLGEQNLVDRFIVFNGKDILSTPRSIIKSAGIIKKTLNEVNIIQYDLGIEPKGDLRYIWMLHKTKCRRTASYNYTGGEYLITDSFSPDDDVKHLIDEKIRLLTKLGFSSQGVNLIPSLKLSPEMKSNVDAYIDKNDLSGKYIIGIHPGASNSNKQFKRYADIIRCLKDKLIKEQIEFIVFEGPAEKDIVDTVCSALNECNFKYTRSKEQLKQYISLVSICSLMICNDSAAGHISAAYGEDVLVLFGPINMETAVPRGSGQIVAISHELGCKPCTLPVCPLGTDACINSITIKECVEGLKNLGLFTELSM
jgi:ADP-heptose:LPS heptosyltransferase